MAHPNQLNPGDLGPQPPTQEAHLINRDDFLADGEARLDYSIQPEGLSLLGAFMYRRKHKQATGARVEPMNPISATPDMDETVVDELLSPVPVPQEQVDPDESMWRVAVMHTLGQHHLDPKTLQNRLPGASIDDLARIVTEMQGRGILGQHNRVGYEVTQKFGDSPEAIRAVALHFIKTRARSINNTIAQIENESPARTQQAGDDLQKQQDYEESRYQAAQRIDGIPVSVFNASNSLNIPLPEMYRIVNKLEHIGFLRVPVLNHGDRPDTVPMSNQKDAMPYPQYERLASTVYLNGSPADAQTALTKVYEAFPVAYDPTMVEVRERQPERPARSGRYASRPNEPAGPQPPEPAEEIKPEVESKQPKELEAFALDYLAGVSRSGKNKNAAFPRMSEQSFIHACEVGGYDTDEARKLYRVFQQQGVIDSLHTTGEGHKVHADKLNERRRTL